MVTTGHHHSYDMAALTLSSTEKHNFVDYSAISNSNTQYCSLDSQCGIFNLLPGGDSVNLNAY